ncbi:MAG TPA: FG-GAP-like repeat-containing protein [Solirubrobacterales bacterium]|nr:FG-GAP-like repeat-containing protein [Solirubrobacterales bacterium]
MLVAATLTLAAYLPATALAAFSFGPAQTRPAGLNQQQVYAIATADVDGDGRLDAVVDGFNPSVIGGDSMIGVMLGRANGSLGPATNYAMPGFGPLSGIATGDFNGDGSPDAVVGSPFEAGIAISLNDGEGAFGPPTVLASEFSYESFVVRDFDGDDHLDVAATGGGAYAVFLGNGDGSFAPGMTEPIDEWALSLAGGDFDADGVVDLALGNVDGSTVRILLGDGDGTFTATTPVDLGPLSPESCGCVESWGIAAGDLDGDGRDDIVVSDRFENRLFSVLSNPDGTFTPRGPFVTGNEGNPIAVALADLDADGKLDAVTADYLENTGTVLSGHGDGTFTAALEVDAGPSPYANAVADIDGDGKPDLLFADQDGNFDGGKVTILRNDGRPAALTGPAAGLDFGDQARQTVSPPRVVTVTNEGDALLHVSGATLAGADPDDFLAATGDCTAAPIRSGRSCTIAVRFVPTAAGRRTAALRVFSDAPAAPASIALGGNGTALPQGPAGSAGAPGPARPRRPRAPLVLALAQKQLLASAGKRFQVRFVTTLPGDATLTASPGGLTARRTLTAAGTATLSLKIRKAGHYKLRLRFRSDDGRRRTVAAKLTVAP